jgi:branched-chain amino acid transport system permease protein
VQLGTQLVINGLFVGAIYALVALGFVLIYKATEIMNFAQGELVLWGGYIGIWLSIDLKLPFAVSFVLTLVIASLFALFVERFILRPMIGQPVVSTIMVTFGLAIMIRAIVGYIWGPDTKQFPRIFPTEPVNIFGANIALVNVWAFVAAVAFVLLFAVYFRYSKGGLAMRAVADDQQAASSMGISVRRVFALSWVIAAIVAAAGALLVGNINGVNPQLALIGLKVFPVVILGGLESIPGAILGGLIIGLLESLAGGYLDPLIPQGGVKELAPFVLLVLILIIRPYGLFGQPAIERV